MEIDVSKGYDPDEVNALLDELTPEQFGILIARQCVKQPSSGNWAVVQYAVHHLDPWDFGFDWQAVEKLIKRIAAYDDNGG